MTSPEKRAWIFAEEHRCNDTVDILNSAKKAATAAWDRKLRVVEAYWQHLRRAANDAGQLELFDIETATPEDVASIIDNPGGE
jgi:hypothetical protein